MLVANSAIGFSDRLWMLPGVYVVFTYLFNLISTIIHEIILGNMFPKFLILYRVLHASQFVVYHLGVIPINISKLMPGIGRDNTDRYSSSNRLFIVPFSEMSAHLNDCTFSSVILLMKYGGNLPVRETSFDDIVYRSE